MSSNIIFIVAIALLSGLLIGRLVKFIGLPNVTGYLIAGLLLGPFIFNVIPKTIVDDFSVVSEMALGFIAFSIGTGFKTSFFKKVGMTPVIIAIAEATGAIILVTGSLLFLGFDPKLSILLGAIAAATAPAQTIMVINQYKAKGPVSTMLLSVVALDDAVALVGFGFATTIVRVLSTHAKITFYSFVQPFLEICISLAIGVAISLMMMLLFRWFKKPNNRICITVASIFLAIWLAQLVDASPLLACMAIGASLVNIFNDINSIAEITDMFTPPLYILFFFMSGAGFDISALAKIGLIGILYIVMRAGGKIFGAWLGGKITKAEKNITKYLGMTLMPQAGVAIGLLIIAGTIVPEYETELHAIILGSTFIYSIIGPSLAKMSLVKAGEIVLHKKERRPLFKRKSK